MNYFYLSESSSSTINQNEVFLAILLFLLIIYIIYHNMICKKNENFMDMEQYNKLMNDVNEANNKAKYGYANPKITSCGY